MFLLHLHVFALPFHFAFLVFQTSKVLNAPSPAPCVQHFHIVFFTHFLCTGFITQHVILNTFEFLVIESHLFLLLFNSCSVVESGCLLLPIVSMFSTSTSATGRVVLGLVIVKCPFPLNVEVIECPLNTFWISPIVHHHFLQNVPTCLHHLTLRPQSTQPFHHFPEQSFTFPVIL